MFDKSRQQKAKILARGHSGIDFSKNSGYEVKIS
jgi:hypothetical protein